MRGPEDVVNQARDGATLEQVTSWMEEAGVTDWLHLCEAAVFMGALDRVDEWSSELTPAQLAVLEMVGFEPRVARWMKPSSRPHSRCVPRKTPATWRLKGECGWSVVCFALSRATTKAPEMI